MDIKKTLLKAAEVSSNILKDNFRGTYEIKSKDSITNLVTEIDHLSEKKIIEIIKESFPDHSILTEESAEYISNTSDYKWIIDPIDGTVNYAHSIPICCVSIAVEKAGEVIMGAVYAPMLNEFYFAEKGKGAFMNDEKISVSTTEDIRRSLLVTGFPYSTANAPEVPLKVFTKIVSSGLPIRRLGSAALDLCWLACGRFDGFWEYNLNAWDVAAGVLLVSEAGGKLTTIGKNTHSIYEKDILATNGKIHSDMEKYL